MGRKKLRRQKLEQERHTIVPSQKDNLQEKKQVPIFDRRVHQQQDNKRDRE